VSFVRAVLRRWPGRVVGGALLVSTAGIIYAIHRRPADPEVGSEEDLAANPASIVPWCADGLEAVLGRGCYAAPEAATGELPLVIYLHGIFEKGPPEEEERDRQRRVARLATLRGFAILALRGVEGGCSIAPERANKVCWPSNEWTADRGPAFIQAWQPALRAASKRHSFGARYVLGFSNGGYFAGLVAVRGLYDASAFVVAHAGPVEPVKALGSKPPVLLLSADDDLSQEGMVRFDDELTREGWPHEHYVREAGGHALPDSDIEAALTFFERTRTETLPLRPALSTRVPRARLVRRDAGADVGIPAVSVPTIALHPTLDAEDLGSLPLAEGVYANGVEPLGASGDGAMEPGASGDP
jgi:dienelactone hydrolase